MTKRNRMTWLFAGTVLAALAYFGWKFTARSAYESAEYRVIESEGAFEIRDYPDLMLATTPTDRPSRGDDGSFMRLFNFISGGNQEERKIAMTVPVFMNQATDDSDATMGFVVPRDVAEHGIPEPTHTAVQINERTGGRFAVVRFSDRLNKLITAEQERLLRDWMAARDLVGADHAETAGYDPPWTPGIFRRNEVLVRLLQAR